MNPDHLSYHWDVIKQRLKKNYKELVDEDLVYQWGKEDELRERIRKRLGKNEETVNKILRDCCY